MRNENWLENGMIYINGKVLKKISDIPWVKHPKFEGVFMKTLFSGSDSNNNLSSLIVKIEPNHEIGNHIHEGKAELHEILEGEGVAIVDNINIKYSRGVISFIPEDINHTITAGNKGLIFFAKFTPALN